MLLSRRPVLLRIRNRRHLDSQQRGQFFLDVDDELRLAELLLQLRHVLLQTRVLLGDQVARRLAAALLWRQPTRVACLFPARDGSPGETLAPQQRPELAPVPADS